MVVRVSNKNGLLTLLKFLNYDVWRVFSHFLNVPSVARSISLNQILIIRITWVTSCEVPDYRILEHRETQSYIWEKSLFYTIDSLWLFHTSYFLQFKGIKLAECFGEKVVLFWTLRIKLVVESDGDFSGDFRDRNLCMDLGKRCRFLLK